jgi:hypothetical protein
MLPMEIDPAAVADVVRWSTLAPCIDPSTSEATTSTPNAANFIQVAVPTIIAPTAVPRILAAAAKTIAPAESARLEYVDGRVDADAAKQVFAEDNGDAAER